MSTIEQPVGLQPVIPGFLGIADPPVFASFEEERRHRKERLVLGLHVLAKLDMDEGLGGHVTVRDPEHLDRFWVNPFGPAFRKVEIDDLLLVTHDGDILEGTGVINPAGYNIHSAIHRARPDVIACAHSHTTHGKAICSLGVKLLPLTQTAAAFFESHAVLDHYPEQDMGQHIADALGPHKAIILANHGLLTVGASLDSCIWWLVSMERQAGVQLAAMAAGEVRPLPDHVARRIAAGGGSESLGWLTFQSLIESLDLV